jgi:hypothetical protein
MLRHHTVEHEGKLTAVSPGRWWNLDDAGAVQRTTTLDFCSLRCLLLWGKDKQVVDTYPEDFEVPRGEKVYYVHTTPPQKITLPAEQLVPEESNAGI